MFDESAGLPTTVAELSFIRDGGWQPERTGAYDRDCGVGRACADEMLEMIGRTENPALFGAVARAITAAGRFEGVETGFCSRIGIFIVAAGGRDAD